MSRAYYDESCYTFMHHLSSKLSSKLQYLKLLISLKKNFFKKSGHTLSAKPWKNTYCANHAYDVANRKWMTTIADAFKVAGTGI